MRPIAVGLAALALGGCALPIQTEIDEASRVARYATRYNHVVGPEANILDRSLSECGEKTAAAETACLREALGGAHLSAKTLAALIPGCRDGRVCHYEHTTRDRLGFVEASATDYVRRWRVDLDFRRPNGDASRVPIAVVDRDDFDAAPAATR